MVLIVKEVILYCLVCTNWDHLQFLQVNVLKNIIYMSKRGVTGWTRMSLSELLTVSSLNTCPRGNRKIRSVWQLTQLETWCINMHQMRIGYQNQCPSTMCLLLIWTMISIKLWTQKSEMVGFMQSHYIELWNIWCWMSKTSRTPSIG